MGGYIRDYIGTTIGDIKGDTRILDYSSSDGERMGSVEWRIKWVVIKIMVPFLGTQNIRCRIILGIRKGTVILTTTQVNAGASASSSTDRGINYWRQGPP